MTSATDKRPNSDATRTMQRKTLVGLAVIVACVVAGIAVYLSQGRARLTADAVVAAWEQAAFAKDQTQLIKWTAPLDAYLPPDTPAGWRGAVSDSLARASAMAGLGLTVRSNPASTVRLIVTLMDEDHAAITVHDRRLDGILVRMAMDVPPPTGPAAATAALADRVALRALGFMGDPDPATAWTSVNGETISALDLLPALHYDHRLRPGMDRRQAVATARAIAGEIAAAGSFIEWHDARRSDDASDADAVDTLVAAYDHAVFPPNARDTDSAVVTKFTAPVTASVPRNDDALAMALDDALRRAALAGAPIAGDRHRPSRMTVGFTEDGLLHPAFEQLSLTHRDGHVEAADLMVSLPRARDHVSRHSYGGNGPGGEERLATMITLRLLGMAGDTDLADLQVPGWGADLVAALAAIHHDPRLAPSLTRDEALPIVRTIATELAAAGSIANWRAARNARP